MRQFAGRGVTPQGKIINSNDKFGNSGIKNQQGSTVIKYDTLPLDGRTEFRFFEGSAQRNFPFSNSGAQGNTLGVGNSLAVERAYLTLIETDPDTGVITTVDSITLTNIPAGVVVAEFGFSIANSEVIKTLPILSWYPQFNKDAENELNNNFEFDTQVVIPPLLEFVATLRTAQYAKVSNAFLRLTIEGTGAIIAPRNTF